jgi:hypothetical protein
MTFEFHPHGISRGKYPVRLLIGLHSNFFFESKDMFQPITIHNVNSSRFSLRIRELLLSSVVIFSLASANAGAQDRPATEELLPETTVLFLQIDDWNDLYTKFQENSAFRLLRDEKIAPLAEGMWNEAKSAYQEELEERVGVALDDIQSIPHGEITIAVVAPRRKTPEVIIFIQTDPEASEAVDRVLDRGRQLVEEEGGDIEKSESDDGFEFETVPLGDNKFKFFRKEGLIVGSTSPTELDHLIDRWMGREVEKVRPLSQNRKFITIMNRCRGTKELKPEARFFVDPIELARSSTRGDVGAQVAINFLPVLGLDGLLAMGGSMLLSEDEFQSVFHAHVLLAEPRKGVFQMFAFRPTDYHPEPWMPKDTVNYFTTSWDVKQMMAELTTIIETFQSEGVVDQFFERTIDPEVGFNFREDLLYGLTGRVTFAQSVEQPISANSISPIFALEVKDPEAMEPILAKIIDRINRDLPEDSRFRWKAEPHNGVMIYAMDAEGMMEAQEARRERRNERRREQGERVYEAEIRLNPTQPSMALVSNYLIISQQSRQAIERIIDTDRGEYESLAANPDFKRVSDKMSRMLKTDMPSAIFYSDPRVAMHWMFDMARDENSQKAWSEISEEERWAGRFKDVYDKHPLPDFSEVEHYFQPQGGYMTSDETGLHLLFFELRADEK